MEESLITFFAMVGLRQELRTIVFPQDPQNMEDLWKSARMAESAVAPTRSSVQPVAITDVFTSGLKDVVTDMAAVMGSKLVQFNPRHESPRHNRTQTTSSGKNGDYICFNCGASHVLTGLHVRLKILVVNIATKKVIMRKYVISVFFLMQI